MAVPLQTLPLPVPSAPLFRLQPIFLDLTPLSTELRADIIHICHQLFLLTLQYFPIYFKRQAIADLLDTKILQRVVQYFVGFKDINTKPREGLDGRV